MAKVTIDGKECDTETMSDEAKNNLGALQFTEMEIQRTQAMLASLQTARMAYGNALKQALENAKPASQPKSDKPFHFSSETVKFS